MTDARVVRPAQRDMTLHNHDVRHRRRLPLKMSAPLCYARTMGCALMRSRALWISTIVIALFCCVYIFYPMTISSDETWYGVYQTQLANIRDSLDGAHPDSRTDALQNMEAALEKVIANWNTPSRISDLADYLDIDAEFTWQIYESGQLVGDYSTVLYMEGSAWIMRGIANLPNPTLYGSTANLPPATYLLYLTGNLPYFLWYIPLLIAITTCAKEREGDALLASAPMNRPCTILALFMLLLAFSFVALLAEWLPACAMSLFKNGPDDFAYPVAFVANNTLFTSTIGLSMLKWTIGFMAESALFSLMAALFLALKASRASQATIATMLAIPMLPGYLTGSTPAWLLKYLPTTYLEAARFTGVPSTSALMIEAGVGCTFKAGIACILGWLTGVLLLGVAVCALSHLVRTRRKGGFHA